MHPHAVVFSRIEERIRNMAPLRIETYVVGPVQTNCYFAVNEDTDEVIVIDPGASARQLAAKVKEEGLKPAAILLTHGHFDHATGAGELSELLGVKVYAFEKEKETLENPQLNLSGWQGSSLIYHADCFLKDEQELDLAGFHIRVLLHRDIRWADAVTISLTRTSYSAGIPYFRHPWEEQTSRGEACQTL